MANKKCVAKTVAAIKYNNIFLFLLSLHMAFASVR